MCLTVITSRTMQFCDKKKSLGKIFVYKQILACSHYKDTLIKIYYKQR